MQINISALRTLAQHPPGDVASRRELYDAARELMFAVESPMDTEHRFFSSNISAAVAHTACDLRIFEHLAAEPKKDWNVKELAQACGADPVLLHRFLRYLAALGLVKELSEGIYAASNQTQTAARPAFLSGLIFHSSNRTPYSLPEFLCETNYRNPTDPEASVFSKTHGLPIMAFLGQNPDVASKWFKFMEEHRAEQPTWMNEGLSLDDFQLREEDKSRGRVMIVDVGGGAGHQCFAFRKRFPEMDGKMVVQDMPFMIDMIDKKQAQAINLELLGHDFNTPQPVRHAKVYYLRNVLHDWPDEQARKILHQLRSAMASDSVVVIDEIVIPPVGATAKQVHYDLAMMITASAFERSEKQWRSLLEGTGIQLRNIWVYDKTVQWALIFGTPV